MALNTILETSRSEKLQSPVLINGGFWQQELLKTPVGAVFRSFCTEAAGILRW